MIKKILFFILGFQTLFTSLPATSKNFLLKKTEPQHIFINNRILAQVNGKPITVIDLMKKMDMIFYKQFPEYSSSIEARYQFYNMSWKAVLKEFIEKELIMTDAAEVKMEVSNGDVRQEMEDMFGPNIIANLEKTGLSYEEAFKIIKDDLLLKRMMMSRVNAKAARSVSPADVRAAYEEFAKTNAKSDSWSYQVISIKGKDLNVCQSAANWTHHLATKEKIALSALEKEVRSQFNSDFEYTLSDIYTQSDKEISTSYREILAKMKPDSFSMPLPQEGKSKDIKIFRIFYLKEFIPGGAPALADVEAKLKNQLISQKIEAEGKIYLDRLKAHFDVQDGENGSLYPKDFQPFILK